MDEYKRITMVEFWIAEIYTIDPSLGGRRDYGVTSSFFSVFPTQEQAREALEKETGVLFSQYARSVYLPKSYQMAEYRCVTADEKTFKEKYYGR